MCWGYLAAAANEVSLTSTSPQRRLLATCLETLRLQQALESLSLDVNALRDGTKRLAAVTAVTAGAAATALRQALLCTTRFSRLGEIDLHLSRLIHLSRLRHYLTLLRPLSSTTVTAATTTTTSRRIRRHFIKHATQKPQAEQETHADGSTVNCWAFAAAFVLR